MDVQADFITSVGNKNVLTIAAEAQANTGHDVARLPTWEVQNYADKLEPIDDVMKRLTDAVRTGQPRLRIPGEDQGPLDGGARSVPAPRCKGPCGRISVLQGQGGHRRQAMYPGQDGRTTAAADNWTYDTHLKAAEACHKAGMTFGIGLGQTSDSVDTVGVHVRAPSAPTLVDDEGNITGEVRRGAPGAGIRARNW